MFISDVTNIHTNQTANFSHSHVSLLPPLGRRVNGLAGLASTNDTAYLPSLNIRVEMPAKVRCPLDTWMSANFVDSSDFLFGDSGDSSTYWLLTLLVFRTKPFLRYASERIGIVLAGGHKFSHQNTRLYSSTIAYSVSKRLLINISAAAFVFTRAFSDSVNNPMIHSP